MNRIISSKNLTILAIVLVGILSFVAYVTADTASTTVTVGNSVPTITAHSLVGGDFTVNENNFKWATSTMVVTDGNGCNTITNVTATFFLASTTAEGTLCTYDGSTCYSGTTCIASTTSPFDCTGGADTTVSYDCGFQVWYPATATDGSAPIWGTSIWAVSATSTDGSDFGTATNTVDGIGIEMVTLAALSVTSSISFPQTSANSDTGTTNQTVTVTNTGNIAGDTDIGGDVMCTDYSACTGEFFSYIQMHFDLDEAPSADYSDLSLTLAASTSPATIETVLVKPTSTTTPVTDDTYWGIAIPSGQANGSYTGQNTFTAVAD